MLENWIKIVPLEQLPCGQMLEVECEGKLLCLYNLGGKVYATDARCTHGDASLAEGSIIGGEVECPYHQGLFDIATGRATGSPCTEDIRTYPTRIEDGSVAVSA